MKVLGIETSCDETSAAVVEGGTRALSSIVFSQSEHLEYGGIVPEIAARAHLNRIQPVVRKALDTAGVTLDQIDAVAATCGPGLVGALLVGFGFGSALAWARRLPFIGVNHIEGHLLSPVLNDPDFEPPFVGLVVSGGHTELVLCESWHSYRILGSTLDDAAGEAFDKIAVLLDLGYPGGPRIERAARQGRPDAYAFPRAWLDAGRLDMSFSGLKTSVRRAAELRRSELKTAEGDPLPVQEIADLAASFQEAVVEVLATRLRQALERCSVRRAVVAGGVAANGPLRERCAAVCSELNASLYLPSLDLCGDNAAMIAAAGSLRLSRGERWLHNRAPVADLETLGL